MTNYKKSGIVLLYMRVIRAEIIPFRRLKYDIL